MMKPSFLLLASLSCGVAVARDSHVGVGSAIVPAYTLQSEAIAPNAAVTMLACVTNDNPHSVREIATQDSFSFGFGAGTVVSCPGLTVHSPSGDFMSSDFECIVEGASSVVIRRLGPTLTWRPGEQICARVEFLAPASSASVRCEYDVASEGAYAPPMPHYLALAVDDGLGVAGPAGPAGAAGPMGPPGPPGPSPVGGRWLLTSTSAVAALKESPPVDVPGLQGALTVAAGSSLQVHLDTMFWACPAVNNARTDDDTRLWLLLDGMVVAQRFFGSESPVALGIAGSWRNPTSLSWLSAPLSAGAHSINVQIWNGDAVVDGSTSACIGSADDKPEYKARLIAVELRQ